MRYVYILVHISEIEDEKLIGFYTTEAQAKEAMERAKLQPGFCDVPEGFIIIKNELDKDHWTKGFTGYKPRSRVFTNPEKE